MWISIRMRSERQFTGFCTFNNLIAKIHRHHDTLFIGEMPVFYHSVSNALGITYCVIYFRFSQLIYSFSTDSLYEGLPPAFKSFSFLLFFLKLYLQNFFLNQSLQEYILLVLLFYKQFAMEL